MVCDWDDMTEERAEWAIPMLEQLVAIRPDFKCTLFAIPMQGTKPFWRSLNKRKWLELAVHGRYHKDAHECQEWSKERMLHTMDLQRVRQSFVHGFKAPGWLISDACYEALLERDWWVADQPYNNDRRPPGLRCHLLGSPDHHHGHVQDTQGNGLRETWPQVEELVREAEGFEFMSEAVR